MPHEIPEQVRATIVRMSQMGYPQGEIAGSQGVSERSVRNIMQLWRDTGDVKPVAAGATGRPRLLDHDVMWYLRELLVRQPDLYLDELTADLSDLCGIDVSEATLWRSLDRCGITRKKLDRRAMERSEEARTEFREAVAPFRPEMFTFVDESGVDVRTTYRGHGYALQGERASRRAFFVRGDRYSLLPALSITGITALDVIKGSCTTDIFKSFIEKLLDRMNPYPGDNSIIIMDNCRIHKSREITDMIAARGMQFIFLPSYSPDFNPIELAFSKIKSCIRRDGDRARLEMRSQNDPEAEANIEAMFYRHVFSITAQDAEGYFQHCGYIR